MIMNYNYYTGIDSDIFIGPTGVELAILGIVIILGIITIIAQCFVYKKIGLKAWYALIPV